jgi:hypothetical protein
VISALLDPLLESEPGLRVNSGRNEAFRAPARRIVGSWIVAMWKRSRTV